MPHLRLEGSFNRCGHIHGTHRIFQRSYHPGHVSVVSILTKGGIAGVAELKRVVTPYSATGETVNSIRFEVVTEGTKTTLRIIGRKFFKALETGRGPRKSTTYQQYDLNILEYMKARGIGSDLPDKKRKQLAKFIAYKINKEGDATFKKGGRIVYSPVITKLIADLKQAVKKDLIGSFVKEILNGTNGKETANTV